MYNQTIWIRNQKLLIKNKTIWILTTQILNTKLKNLRKTYYLKEINFYKKVPDPDLQVGSGQKSTGPATLVTVNAWSPLKRKNKRERESNKKCGENLWASHLVNRLDLPPRKRKNKENEITNLWAPHLLNRLDLPPRKGKNKENTGENLWAPHLLNRLSASIMMP